MAGEPTYFKGQDLIVSVGGIMVGCDKSATFELSTDTFDITSKCTVDPVSHQLYSSVIPTTNNYKISGNGFTILDNSASGGQNEVSTAEMIRLLLAQTKVLISWTRGDNVLYSFNGYFTAIKETGTVKEVSTYDYTIMSTGLMTIAPLS